MKGEEGVVAPSQFRPLRVLQRHMVIMSPAKSASFECKRSVTLKIATYFKTCHDSKFELLRYGMDQQLKEDTLYFSADDNIIEEKEVLRYLGIMMNNKATFENS